MPLRRTPQSRTKQAATRNLTSVYDKAFAREDEILWMDVVDYTMLLSRDAREEDVLKDPVVSQLIKHLSPTNNAMMNRKEFIDVCAELGINVEYNGSVLEKFVAEVALVPEFRYVKVRKQGNVPNRKVYVTSILGSEVDDLLVANIKSPRRLMSNSIFCEEEVLPEYIYWAQMNMLADAAPYPRSYLAMLAKRVRGSLLDGARVHELEAGDFIVVPASVVCNSDPDAIDKKGFRKLTIGSGTTVTSFETETMKAKDGKGDWTRKVEVEYSTCNNDLARETVRWEVLSIAMTGGGTGHGPHDVYPDGLEITCRSVERKEILRFYASGCFTCQLDPRSIIVLGE